MKPDYERRREKLWRRVGAEGLDSFLVTDVTNVTYLTGFTGDSTCLYIDRERQMLISDTRYSTQIAEESPDLQTHIRDASSTPIDSIARIAKSAKPKSMGVESAHISKWLFDKLSEKVACPLVDTEGWIEEQRAIKDESEIAKIRESIRVSERAFQVIRSQLTGDQTERQIAHNMEHQIRAFGGSRCAFEPIVGVGARSALPHGTPTTTRIGESGFVLVDWGSFVDGYASDLTRVLVAAKIPPKLRTIYDTVLKAQLAAIAKIRPDATFKSVDAAARGLIANAGFGKKFGHGLGHGFGLQVHESPFVSPIRDGVFQPNMIVTVEPGIYLPGIGGVRIEDDILVTKNGNEVLSSLPKSFDACIVDI